MFIGANKNIFEYDYDGMKQTTSIIRDELVRKGIIKVED